MVSHLSFTNPKWKTKERIPKYFKRKSEIHFKMKIKNNGLTYKLRASVLMLFSVFLVFICAAQQTDSLRLLSPIQFMEWVRKNHPVAKQAALYIDQAEAELLATRGMFDPMLYYTSVQKTFDSKTYYNYRDAAIKIPTWMGIELMAGLENHSGEFPDPELTLGKSSYAGFSVPLAKNLLMDKRRAALGQAKIFVEMSQAEQRAMVNDLLFEAMGVYWQWAADYQRYLILSDAVAANEERYKLIQLTVEQGDRAGVDSTEALTQLLQFSYEQNEANMQFINTGYQLSTYLWSDNELPVLLSPEVKPMVLPERSNPIAQAYKPLDDLLQLARENHPKLRVYDNKLEILELERKLKFQSLLPTLNLTFNALPDGYEFWQGWSPELLNNNNKFGAQFVMPLFLRQGRGDYRGAKLKIRSTELEQANVQVDIENKVKAYYNEQVNLLAQIRISERAFNAWTRLFEVEQQRFSLGESTLFLINSRELKMLEARQKLAELKAKFFKTAYGVEWAAGLLQ